MPPLRTRLSDGGWQLLVDPTLAEVNALLGQLATKANGRNRARTAELEIDEEDWAESTYLAYAGGHGVAKAYAKKGYGRVGTTVAGVVWASGADDRRYVLVQVARRETWPGTARQYPFGYVPGERSWLTMIKFLNTHTVGLFVHLLVPGEDKPGPSVEQRRLVLRLVETEEYAASGVDKDQLADWCLCLRAYTRLWDAHARPENRTVPRPR